MALDLRTAPTSGVFGEWPEWRQDAGLLWHPATDYPSPLDNPILAPDDGDVLYSGPGWSLGTLGYYTIFDAGDYGLLLAHQDRAYPELVRKGVKKGQTIGYSGNTGWSTGPHVHAVMSTLRYRNGAFDFARESGGVVDPRAYLNNGYRDESVLTSMFVQGVAPGNIWHVVTKRVVTKAELYLLGRLGVKSVYIHIGGRWFGFSPDAPAFVNAVFPAVLPSNVAVMVNRKN